MTDRPILFSAPMVRALLDGRKTQTRRILKKPPPPECGIHFMIGNESWLDPKDRTPLRHHWEAWGGDLYRNRPKKHMCGIWTANMPCTPGDRLWVRERCVTITGGKYRGVRYIADGTDCGSFNSASEGGQWDAKPRPSIHMPRWASRLTLTVTDVRVQRLQEISEEDAIAEGVAYESTHGPVGPYALLWEVINGPGSWKANPWVVAVSFRAAQHNIDQVSRLTVSCTDAGSIRA